MRGFSFQILRSIDAWLDLPSGEILMLEGAEDLDRIGPEGALVEQVKDTAGSGNITLRTAAVLAAIGNFWQHCQRNPDTLIRFRYLTTSDIGQERSDALADLDAAGIEAWQAIRHAPTSTEALSGAALIQSYLVGCESLPAALRTFLSSASVEDFVKSVVLPIEWVTGQARSPGLVRKIEARLVELGELLDIDAASAINALPKLHLEAWKNVSDNDRAPLRRGDLIRIVREAGTTHVTSALLMGLLKQVAGMPSGATPIVSPPPSVGRPPRPPRRHYSRPVLEENLRRALRLGATYLHGSTGMGKTYLARSVMIDLTKVGWLDLRDVRGQAIISKIQAATAFLASNADAMTIVLDDLDPGEDGRVLIPALQHLHEMLSARGGALLITGPQPLSPRLAHAIDITADRTFIAPAFALAEIAEFTAAAGCPDTDVENWSKIVSASTSGHPQLVDARLAALQQQGWPKPSLGEFVSQTAEIKDVRNEARRLVATLPEGERELLCRASLVIGRISRRRLLAVGAAEPGLFEPGHVIDRLTGPWLEVTDTSDLRVSPLLRGLASETRPQAWAREMNVNIAWAWLADPSLAAGDVSTLLMHAILGKRTGPLVQLLPSLLEASEDVWDEIGVTAGFLASLGVDEEHPNPFDAPLDKAVFRILQLRIAAQAQTQELPKIIDRAFKEFSEAAPEDLATGFFEFLFLWQLIRLDGMTHEVAALVDIGLRFRRAATRMSQNLNKLQQHNGAEHVNSPTSRRSLP
ncbi:ATP-dependent transcriptional regulator [Agrobacterium tumefaciens]|nr:ATP-dependent transcriptional regulator [Agrobacterium tumefaciens]